MARRKSKARRKSQRESVLSRIGALLSGDGGVTQAISTSVTIVILIGVGVGLVIGRPHMRRRAAALRTQEVEIRFEWPAMPGAAGPTTPDPARTWMDADSRAMLESIAASWLGPHPFDGASLREAQRALMETGWFRRPCTLERHADGSVRISGAWRIPSGVVRFDGMDRLVSVGARRLPPEYPYDTSGRKAIVGADPARQMPGFGEPWPDGGVQAAIDLLGFVSPRPWYGQVYGVDISEYRTRQQLTILTTSGNRILWGGPIDTFNAGQARPAEKLRRLDLIYDAYGSIDAGRSSIDVSLQHGPEIDHNPSPRPGS